METMLQIVTFCSVALLYNQIKFLKSRNKIENNNLDFQQVVLRRLKAIEDDTGDINSKMNKLLYPKNQS